MKIKYLILLLITFSSCKDDIENSEYRNSDYVFYKENGKQGYWQKISKDSDFKYKKGILNYFYNNGNRFGEIEVLDSFPNRIEKLYDKDNNKLIKTVWVKNDSEYKRVYENGYHKHYYSNKGKVIIEEGLVENNLERGLWKRYWNDGSGLKQVINFKDGKTHGKRENYWKNGNLESVSHWNMDKQIGEGILYYENGNLKESNFVKNGKLHGLNKTYYSDGTLESICKYWYGKSTDTCKTFYPNGKLKKLDITILDTISLTSFGKVYTYYENGNLHKEVEGKNYQVNGKAKIFFENGNLNQEFIVKNGIKNGELKGYYESGELWFVGNAKNDLHHGSIKYYDKKGKLIKTIIAENGIAIDSIIN